MEKLDVPVVRECPNCGEEFITDTNTKQFCSTRCRSEAFRKRDIASELRIEINKLKQENDSLKKEIESLQNRLNNKSEPTLPNTSIKYCSCPYCCVLLERTRFVGYEVNVNTRKRINCPNCHKSISYDGQTDNFWKTNEK